MSRPSAKFLKTLKEAIAIEKQGHRFYLDTAKRLSYPLARKTLRALAKDEEKHIEALEEFYRKECTIDSCPAVKNLFKKSHQTAKKSVLAEPEKLAQKLKPDAGIKEVYGIALKLEEKGYTFYQQASVQAETEDAKRLLEFLMAEENAHYALLSETQDYLENPGDWFLKEEKGVIEGG